MAKCVVFQLGGGVGNQLFRYAAGKWFSRKTGVRVLFDARLLSIEKNHGGLITDFKIADKILISKTRFSWGFWIASAQRIGRNRIKPLLPSDVQKRLGSNTYIGSLGFDAGLLQIKNQTRVSGHFQSYVYAQECIDEIRSEIQLRSSSFWFERELAQLKKHKVLAVHVRRGDYIKYQHWLGILSTMYYRTAIQNLIANGHHWEEIWVFSDDLVKARVVFESLEIDHSIKYVDPPLDCNPLESLILFSHANFGIIANSTFSWWAAFLSEEMKAVVAPDKWFRNKKDPESLIPDHWLRVRSEWE